MIYVLRQLLESNTVAETIDNWIDLIFGKL